MKKIHHPIRIFALISSIMLMGGINLVALTYKEGQPSASASATSAAIEKDDFRFQSVGCQRKGAEVTCSALITNLADSDRVIGAVVKYYNPISRIIDTSGDQYNSNLVRIGQNESSQYLETNLAPGTPLKINFVFKDVPGSVTNLASFEVSYYFYLKNGNFTPAKSVTLRDVTIK